MTTTELIAAAVRRGYTIGVRAEDSWSHPAMLYYVKSADGTAIYRRPPSRAAADFGPQALMRAVPNDVCRIDLAAERSILADDHKRMTWGDSPEGWARATAQLPDDWDVSPQTAEDAQSHATLGTPCSSTTSRS